jgi:hypothetical protein
MEEEINCLLNTTSLTDIILVYDNLEKKINEFEKKIINLNNQIKTVNKDPTNISKLNSLLEKTTDTKIKDLSIEELIKIYENISKLCLHN